MPVQSPGVLRNLNISLSELGNVAGIILERKLSEYATKNKIISQEESNRIPITNVTRLINSREVRDEIGLIDEGSANPCC